MEKYKGRQVVAGQRVKVYRNLHTSGYSVADAKSGLVLAHADAVTIKDVVFHVSETGRQRVVAEQRRCVHAWCVGTFIAADEPKPEIATTAIYYNPYKTKTFVNTSTQEPIYRSPLAHCEGKLVFSA